MIEEIDINNLDALFSRANALREQGSILEALNYYREASLKSHEDSMLAICEMFFNGDVEIGRKSGLKREDIAYYLSYLDSKNHLFVNSNLVDIIDYYLLSLSKEDLLIVCNSCKNNASRNLQIKAIEILSYSGESCYYGQLQELYYSVGDWANYTISAMKCVDLGDYSCLVSYADHLVSRSEPNSSFISDSLISIAEDNGYRRVKSVIQPNPVIKSEPVVKKQSKRNKSSVKRSRPHHEFDDDDDCEDHRIHYQSRSTASNRESMYSDDNEWKEFGEDWNNSYAPYYNEDQHSNWDEPSWD